MKEHSLSTTIGASIAALLITGIYLPMDSSWFALLVGTTLILLAYQEANLFKDKYRKADEPCRCIKQGINGCLYGFAVFGQPC